MITQIIPAGSINPDKPGKVFREEKDSLNISEFFCDSIQGEGIYIGYPAAFLRLQGCSLNCCFCDSREVWRHGSAWDFDQIFKLMENADLPSKLKAGQHLVITGGSPLLQQKAILKFLSYFNHYFGFKPFVEIENECVILPSFDLCGYVNCWNNSPKLENSKTSLSARYNQSLIQFMSSLKNSWFKFVIGKDDNSWKEIEAYYLGTGIINSRQIILMPEGATREELLMNREYVLELAVKHNVRYTTREHIILWDKKTGC